MPIIDRARIAAALPGYTLGRELGAGAFGLVLAGRHLDLDRDVAIKVISVGGEAGGGGGAARALTLLDHPHLAPVHEVVADRELGLLVSDLVPGGSVARQNLTPPAACAVVLGMADALVHAHGAGILHRAITPENILFTAGGQPKLTDLGVVGLFEEADATAGRIAGTPLYLAPEQITGGRLGPATDLYVLATVLYELLTGVPIFDPGLPTPELFRRQCTVMPPPPVGVPGPVAQVLGRALAKNPAERPRMALQFALDLAGAARSGYGPGWLDRAEVPLYVSDALRERSVGDQTSRPVSSSSSTSSSASSTSSSSTTADLLHVGPARPGPSPGPQATPERGPMVGSEAGPAEDGTTTRLDPPGPDAAPPLADPAARPGPSGLPRLPSRNGPSDRPGSPGVAPGRDGGARRRVGILRLSRTAVLAVAAAAVIVVAAAALALPRILDGDAEETAEPAPAPVAPSGPGVWTPPPSAPVSLPPPPSFTAMPVAGTGEAAYSGDDGPAGDAALNGPFGLTIDGLGSLYVADFDNHRIRRISPDGIIVTIAGTGESGFSGDGGPATAAMLASPSAVAVDPAGNVYIADTFNHRIRRVDTAGVITTIAGRDDRGYSGDGGPATEATLWFPSGVAPDGAGGVFVADAANDLVRRVGADGVITTVAGGYGEGPYGDGGPAGEALLAFPMSVATDRAGQLYVADSGNHRIRRIGLDGVIETIAGTGLPGYSGDGGPATEATLRSPRGVAVDAAGNIFITDRNNHRIRRVDPAGTITTIAGTAPPGRDTSADPDALLPDGQVAVDPAGNVYVSDRGGNRVIRVELTG